MTQWTRTTELSRVNRVRFEIRSLIGRYPLYTPYLRWKHEAIGLNNTPGWGVGIVDKNSSLVVEAFWRSANTFAVAALLVGEHPPSQIAHHGCSPSQVIVAKRLNIPTLLIVRPPKPTILSCLRWAPYSAEQWLRAYIRYYSGMIPATDWAFVAHFDEVTSDFGSVLRSLNLRFNTAFGPFNHSPENVRRCFDLIETNDRLMMGNVDESQVSRPSGERTNRQEEFESIYLAEKLAGLRQRAEAAFASVAITAATQTHEAD